MSDVLHDWAVAAEILDHGWIFHLGVLGPDGVATSMPMLYVRDERSLLLHGGVANETLQSVLNRGIAAGNVTLVDGLVVARSAFQSSVAYRSVSVNGTMSQVEGDEKEALLRRVTEGLIAGRVDEIRPMTSGEVRGTVLLRLTITSAVARISLPEVHDTPSDVGGPQWAGVIPIDVLAGDPQRAADVPTATSLPPSVQWWTARRG